MSETSETHSEIICEECVRLDRELRYQNQANFDQSEELKAYTEIRSRFDIIYSYLIDWMDTGKISMEKAMKLLTESGSLNDAINGSDGDTERHLRMIQLDLLIEQRDCVKEQLAQTVQRENKTTEALNESGDELMSAYEFISELKKKLFSAEEQVTRLIEKENEFKENFANDMKNFEKVLNEANASISELEKKLTASEQLLAQKEGHNTAIIKNLEEEITTKGKSVTKLQNEKNGLASELELSKKENAKLFNQYKEQVIELEECRENQRQSAVKVKKAIDQIHSLKEVNIGIRAEVSGISEKFRELVKSMPEDVQQMLRKLKADSVLVKKEVEENQELLNDKIRRLEALCQRLDKENKLLYDEKISRLEKEREECRENSQLKADRLAEELNKAEKERRKRAVFNQNWEPEEKKTKIEK